MLMPSAGVAASGSTAAAAGTPRAGSAGRLPRKVCTMCCCQPGTVCTRMSSKPAAVSRFLSAVTPSNCSALRHR